jgi:hypothetical protein
MMADWGCIKESRPSQEYKMVDRENEDDVDDYQDDGMQAF